jgi:hypothetical protein
MSRWAAQPASSSAAAQMTIGVIRFMLGFLPV